MFGAKRLRRVRPDERAKSWEKWFQMRPTIAAKSREVRVAAIRAIQDFTEAYREAWRRFSEGEYDVVFPAGTWWVCRYAGAVAACSFYASAATEKPSLGVMRARDARRTRALGARANLANEAAWRCRRTTSALGWATQTRITTGSRHPAAGSHASTFGRVPGLRCGQP